MMYETPSRQEISVSAGDSIKDLLKLIDSLIEVVSEENAALAKGLPASQSRHTEMKIQLGDQFEKWVVDVSMRNVLLCSPNRSLQEKVLQRIGSLSAAMDENMIRLRAAIAASQRRIDAVMAALREQMLESSPYNAKGCINAHSARYGMKIQI